MPIQQQAESGTPLGNRLPLCRRRQDRTSPEPPPIAAYFVSPSAALRRRNLLSPRSLTRPGVGVDLDLGPYVGVWSCGKITPTLVTESAVVVPYCEVSLIGTSDTRNRSAPAAPVADTGAHLQARVYRSYHLVRRICGITNTSTVGDDLHCIPIGRGDRQLKRVLCCFADHPGA
jgi:hypothetical protein